METRSPRGNANFNTSEESIISVTEMTEKCTRGPIHIIIDRQIA